MKLKNDFIRIKVGNKKYEYNNLILDEFLERYAKSQIDKQFMNKVSKSKKMNYCFLKFDTPFEIKPDMTLHNNDFDVALIPNEDFKQYLDIRQIIAIYNYKLDSDTFIYDYKTHSTMNKLSDYYDKKITAIGFNSWWGSDESSQDKWPICAILDTSNYNIYIQENQDLVITRQDTITTDAIFSSNSDKIKCPVHLTPDGMEQLIYQEPIYNEDRTQSKIFNDNAYGYLYSVGLGKEYNELENEKIIENNVEVNKNEILIKGIKNYKEYSKSTLLNFVLNGVFNDNILKRKKYIILKYKVFQNVHSGTFDNVITTLTDTGYYYYQAIPIDKYGKTNLRIKYERS